MSISIITPHYNDPTGLQQVHKCLLAQTQALWEWVIVDDFSDENTRKIILDWHQEVKDNRVKLICNAQKGNASVCRNLGADMATYENLVFLDSDDAISANFIKTRHIEFTDFAVFKNTAVIDQQREIQFTPQIAGNYLDYFLQARFIWPITAIVWKKTFFNSLGKFNPQLPRLQDVELAIRAMQNSVNYIVIDNEVDFYYSVKPIRSRKNFLKPVSDATYIFIDKLLQTQNLTMYQLSLLSGYYFMNTKYLERSKSRKEVGLVHRNLMLFYKKGYIGFFQVLIGVISLKLYKWQIFSGSQFLRVNRFVFKSKQ